MTDRRYEFVVFSDDWGRHPSSCQHLFGRISQKHRVLWVNTIGLRAPAADSFTIFRGFEKIKEWSRPLRRIHDNLWVLAPVMLPVAGDGVLGRINRKLTAWAIRRAMKKADIKSPVLWTSVPTGADYIGRLGESTVVYYVTDDYAHWPGGNAQIIRDQDRRLTGRADAILACNEFLAESHRGPKGPALVLPHAVDFEHFSRRVSEPQELREIPHPRVCFFGLIYEKIDLDALHELASRRPDIHLVLLGLVKTNVDRLASLANVHFLGAKPYDELPAWLGAMDVFVMPYVADEETRAKGPLKIRECLAVGKPTVARRIPDLASFADMVHLYDTREEFVNAVSTVCGENHHALAERMRERVRFETWEARVRQVMDVLNTVDDRAVHVSSHAPDWSEFLAGHAEANIFHDARWGRVMEAAYGNTPFYLTARREGKVAGILQLVEQKSRLFGSHLCSLPYFDAAGILADDQQTVEALLDRARGLLASSGAKWVELRHRNVSESSLPSRTDKVDLRLVLPDTPDTLWNQLNAKVRNQVRKSQSMNLTLHAGATDLLSEFYAVYVRNMRDLGSPPHSRRFFELIIEHFPEAVRVFVVRSDSTPVAGAFTLADRGVMYVPWAASDWRAKHLCPNMFLYWSMLSDAIQWGAKIFDFGRSTRDSGTYRFKKQWGAQEYPLVWEFVLAPNQKTPSLRPDSAKYQFLVNCWRRMPVALARMLGPALISKLS